MTRLEEEQARQIERLRARVAALEKVMQHYRLPIPPVDPGLERPGTAPLPDIGAALRTEAPPPAPPPARPEVPSLQVQAALEIHPHLMQKICQLWGKDGLEPFLASLVIDDRGDRKGLSAEVMEELLSIGRIYRVWKALFGVSLPLTRIKRG